MGIIEYVFRVFISLIAGRFLIFMAVLDLVLLNVGLTFASILEWHEYDEKAYFLMILIGIYLVIAIGINLLVERFMVKGVKGE